MKIVLQRVSRARVTVDGKEIGAVGNGILVLAGFEKGDDRKTVEEMCQKILRFRLFPDDAGNMNLDLRETGGDLLVVPNFTLCADTESGNRPGFGPAADPDHAEKLFDYMCNVFRSKAPGKLASGSFGAMMDVSLTNDGPVTFLLEN